MAKHSAKSEDQTAESATPGIGGNDTNGIEECTGTAADAILEPIVRNGEFATQPCEPYGGADASHDLGFEASATVTDEAIKAEASLPTSHDSGADQLSSVAVSTVSSLKIDQLGVPPDAQWTKRLETTPAIVLDHAEIAGVGAVVRAASMRGGAHDMMAEPRQDAYSIRISDTAVHIAVCDGVGSCELSHEGARVAAEAATHASATGGYGPDVVTAAVEAILRRAEQLSVNPEALSTTLCWVRVSVGDPEASWPVEIAQWGDSEAMVYDTRGLRDGHPNWIRFATDEDPSQLSNVVRPLPTYVEPEFFTRGDEVRWDRGQVLCVFTDGIASDLDYNTDLGHALATCWYLTPTPVEFISQVAFERAGSGDDRTAVVMWRTKPVEQT